MCEVGLLSDIFDLCKLALEDEAHPLHETFQYLLERLSAQKLEPGDLRAFLRLGNPLSCDASEEQPSQSAFVPLSRIKTLVSMTTPRDLHIQNNSILPPFIEFDMAPEGFGCLYLPSLAPSSPHTASSGIGSLASQEGTVIGGIGLGDRAFPCSHPGLTYASWICVDKFSDPRSDPHPVRLLTVGRQVKVGNDGGEADNNFVCLSLCLSAR